MNVTIKALAEMIGTFAIISVGGLSIILSEKHGFAQIGIPLTWGIMVCLMIIAVGPISGAHFNPAVTLAFALTRRIPAAEVAIYWASQFIGGTAAAYLLITLRKI